MIDVKYILDNRQVAEAALARRDPGASFDELVSLAEERRDATRAFNDLRARQKTLSAAFGKKGAQAGEDLAATREELRELSARVKNLEARMRELDEALADASLGYPNLPDPEVPDGRNAEDNPVVRVWGDPEAGPADAREHDRIGEDLGILDFASAARISGARS